jgi:hypothetical protein
MQIKCKLLSVGGIKASDGSLVPRRVFEEYLASDEYKNAIKSRKLLGTLSHAARSAAGFKSDFNPTVSKSIGKEDTMILVGNKTAPTHYITKIWIDDSDQWVWCTATTLDSKYMDDEAVQNIKRLEGLLRNGVKPGISAVILGYWDSKGNGGCDTLKKLVKLKGFDITLSPSWVDAGVQEVIEDDDEFEDYQKYFSNSEDKMKVKTFSDLSEFGENLMKSSKIDDTYTVLKGKVFSTVGTMEILDIDPIEEKEVTYSDTEEKIEDKEKTYSAATVRERLRFAKYSPRMRFRRLFLDYKQLVRQLGGSEKIDPETLKLLKSMFTSDCLDIFKQISPEIPKGKQINVLIGGSSLGKNIRVAAQKLQIPYKLASMEMMKKGYLTPMRMKQLQAAYMDFTQSMVDEVFGPNPIPEGLEEEAEKEEEGGVKK